MVIGMTRPTPFGDRTQTYVGATLVLALVATLVGFGGVAICNPMTDEATHAASDSSPMPCCPEDGSPSGSAMGHCTACASATLPAVPTLTPPDGQSSLPEAIRPTPLDIPDRPFHPPQTSVLPPA